jgi:exoribonuclease R
VPRRHLRLRAAEDARLRAGFAKIRAELRLPESFPTAVDAEARAAAAALTLRPDDMLDLPFLTIDPPGSMDLDQAMHLERRNGGYRVRYAIADVASFVVPAGALDTEARLRGETLYSPDTRTPLHPPTLSEGAASLLPGELRRALLWTIDLDADGGKRAVDVRRAVVRSTDRFDYVGAQAAIDGGAADERLRLLAEVGRLRIAQELGRGGISLPIPEQEIIEDAGRFRLGYRVPLPVESWNEQMSLLTGMAAAQLMLHAEIGVLRTLPTSPSGEIDKLRRAAKVLDVDWPAEQPYAEMIRGLDPANPRHAALLEDATALLRGAGYTAFDGQVPARPTHAAVAAPYAHATAPLRRLVDRYVGEVCVSVCAAAAVPEWVRAALPGLPARMADSDRRAGELERECVALMEAAVLADSVGQTFDAAVIDVNKRGGGTVQLAEPAVRATCDGDLPLGESVRVRLIKADVETRSVRFALAPSGK